MVRALAGAPYSIWAGGDFSAADTLAAAAIARWDDGAVHAPSPAAPFRLGRPVPNPFNPRTRVELVLDVPAHVRADVFDARGRRVAILADRRFESGAHVLDWTTDAASGLYLLRVEAAGTVEMRRLSLIR
jgi:hypothetical protein